MQKLRRLLHDPHVVHRLCIVGLFVIGLISLKALWPQQFYTSHDGPGHLIRMVEFHESITDGQVPVRIAKRINYGLGYPFFEFNYPLVYYTGELMHLLGLSFPDAFKALLAASVFLGAFSMYAFLFPYTGMAPAFTGAVFWTIAPYKFLNMYVRGNVAESMGLALASLTFLAVDRMIRGSLHWVWVSIVFALLLLSHNITAMITVPLVFLYSIVVMKYRSHRSRGSEGIHAKKNYVTGLNPEVTGSRTIRQTISGLSLTCTVSLLLTAWFWLPVTIEAPQTKLTELRYDFREFFPTLREIIYSPWGFGAYKPGSVPGKLSPQLGLAHTAVVILSLAYLVVTSLRKRKHPLPHIHLLAWLFSGLISVFVLLTLPVSRSLWEHIGPLAYVQIPWRFMGYITLSSSVLAAYLVSNTKKSIRIPLVLILVSVLFYANRNHIRVNQYVPFEHPFLSSETYGPSTTSKDEHMPLKAPRMHQVPNPDGDVIPPEAGTSFRITWKSNEHKFAVNLIRAADFRDNTSYFPGWTAYIDGVKKPTLQDSDEFYRLRVGIPAGKHEVQFVLEDPPYRRTANIVSAAGFLMLVAYMVIHNPGVRKYFSP